MTTLRAAVLLTLSVAVASAQITAPFRAAKAVEMTAAIEMRSADSDFAVVGREAAVARVTLDGARTQRVVLWAGAERRTYRVWLGVVAAGEHSLLVERDPEHSAPQSTIEIAGVQFNEDDSQELRHAPVLFARADTIGRFSDVPLLVYCERVKVNAREALEYTVVFSNEDGGTSTRALMARWGRTTDIEYVYRVDPANGDAVIQSRGHKDVEFQGPYDGRHPLLMPVTDNNMVSGEGRSALRFQIEPLRVSLTAGSREKVMDDDPATYRAAAQELAREGKLRSFGAVDGEKISDPRNYLYLEMRITNSRSRLSARVRLEGSTLWLGSNLGRPEYAIERSGWVRLAVELPPGTRPDQIAEIGFDCLTAEKSPSGVCRIEQISRAFFLDRDYRPGADVWRFTGRPFDVNTGEMRTWSLRSR